jgi:hypothetical protein
MSSSTRTSVPSPRTKAPKLNTVSQSQIKLTREEIDIILGYRVGSPSQRVVIKGLAALGLKDSQRIRKPELRLIRGAA